jgi:glycine/D-amino acid oxidase-like deaminating enzyme
MAASLGSKLALELQQLAHRGKEQLKERIRSGRIDCDFRPGYLFVGFRPSHVAILKAMGEFWQEELGIAGARFLSASEIGDQVRSERYRCGLFDPTGASIDPAKLLLGLAQQIDEQGGRIFEGSAAQCITRRGRDRVLVETAGGAIEWLPAISRG